MVRYVVRLMLIALSIIMPASASAQEDAFYRREIGGGVGLTNYIGDYNRALMKGFQPSLNVVYRRNYNVFSSVKIDAAWSKIKGGSQNVTTVYPDEIGSPYTFDRTLIDVNMTYEYNFLPYGTGREYRGAKRLVPFVFFGLGATIATGNGSAGTANIPLGMGVKYKISERMNAGVEWAMHFAMSDNLDGSTDPYYVQSTGLLKNTDCYSSLRLTLTYSFSAKCPTCNKDDW